MRSRTNRALAKLNSSLNAISMLLASDEELRELLFYPTENYDDSLELVSKKEVMEKCTSLVAGYPDYMEDIGAYLVIGIPEFHMNEENSAYMDIVLTIDILIDEGNENYGVGLRVNEIMALIDYLLNQADINGIGLLKLTDGFFQTYTPKVKGYTMIFKNRDMR